MEFLRASHERFASRNGLSNLLFSALKHTFGLEFDKHLKSLRDAFILFNHIDGFHNFNIERLGQLACLCHGHAHLLDAAALRLHSLMGRSQLVVDLDHDVQRGLELLL